MDLLAKMMKLDPDEPTEEEARNGITKLRYMVFREMLSSSRTLGFRIEGIKLGGEEPLTTFKTKKTREEIALVITEQFLPPSIGPSIRKKIQVALRDRLEDLRDAADTSQYFQTHEFIGSSLLFIYDLTGHAGIWMIDFGKTGPTDLPINHRDEWKLGNHEDGYLFGLDTMIDIFNEAVGD
jgi:1D-myo-inositol-triphosphate 3-kinase